MVKQLRHQALRVLLATPSVDLRDVLCTHPETARVIEVVAHAEDAVDVQSLTLAYTPDVILLDTAFPTAVALAHSLLHLTLHQSRLVVLDTGDSSDQQLLHWLQVGASDILKLPLTADQIVSALIRVCDGPRLLAHSGPALPGDTDTLRILLVSKTSGAGERLAAILQQRLERYEVDQTESVAGAVTQAAVRHYTTALIDADQFGRGAFDIATQLRLRAPATCAILLASRADMTRLRLAAQSGVCDYLLKPPSIETLGAALVRARVRSVAVMQVVGGNGAFASHADAHPTGPAVLEMGEAPVPVTSALTTRGRVFTVYSPGGGTGCTALACGLALALRQRDVRVALLDGDVQFGNAATLLNLHTDVTLDRFVERMAFIRWPDEELARHPSGLYVLPAPADIVQGAMVSAEEMFRVLQRLRTHYEVVVVDAPHALNEYSVRLLKAADHILVPVRAWETQRRRITALHELLGSRGFNAQRLHLIQSGFRRDPDIDAATVVNLDVLAAQLAAGDEPDLDALRELIDELLR